MMKKLLKNTIVLSLAGIAFLILVWGIAYFFVGNEYVLPSPWETALAMGKLLGNAGFYAAFFATLGRAALAFLISCVLGIGLAVIAYLSPTFEKCLRGIVAILRALPTMAVLLILLMWVSHDFAPVVIGALTLFPLLYTAAYSSLCGVDEKLIEMSRVYRVPQKEQIKGLFLPTALPKLLCEGVAAFSFGLKLTVSAEVLTFTYRSLGGWMQDASLAYEVATMMALTAIVCLLGAAIEVLGVWLVKRWEESRCG